MKHHTPGATTRRQRLRRHVCDAFTIIIGSNRLIGREVALLYAGVVANTSIVSLLYWAELSHDGAANGIIRLLVIALIVTPISALVLLGTMLIIYAVGDWIADESLKGRRQRRRLREALRELRRAIKTPGDDRSGFERQRSSYRHNDTDAATTTGPWTRLLARRVSRRRQRLAQHVQAVYDGSFERFVGEFLAAHDIASKGALDQTDSVWSCIPSVRALASLRVLEGHAPLTGSIAFERRLAPETSLVFSPRWVYDMVEFFEARTATSLDEHMFTPWSSGHRHVKRRQCVPLAGADPETVLKLYEPHGQGPFADLDEVVRAALLV